MLKKRLYPLVIAVAVFVGACSNISAQTTMHVFGLPNTSLGYAELDTIDNILNVSNIGQSGQDGVSIDLGRAQFGSVSLNGFNPAVKPFGAFRKTTAIGEVEGVPGQTLGFLLEVARGDTVNLRCGFPVFGVSSATVEIYESVWGDPHIYEDVDLSQIFAQVFGFEGHMTVTSFMPVYFGGVNFAVVKVSYSDAPHISIGGNSAVPAKCLIIRSQITAEEPGWSIDEVACESVNVTGKQFGSFAVVKEALGMFGNSHLALGMAHFGGGDVGPAPLIMVSNIGSSGEEGVRITRNPDILIALDDTSEFAVQWDDSGYMTPGSSIGLRAVGSVGGLDGQDLGSIRCDRKVTRFEILYDTTESPENMIRIFDDGQLVLEVADHRGIAAVVDEPPTGGSVGTNSFSFSWEAPVLITVSGEPPVYGNRLTVVPEGAIPADYVGYVDIMLKDLNQFNITNEIVEPWYEYFMPVYIGDANGDGLINISDATALIGYIFGGGTPPEPLEAGDANCDGMVNIADVVTIIGYIFCGGPEPGSGCRGGQAKLGGAYPGETAEIVLRVHESATRLSDPRHFEIAVENNANIAGLQLEFTVEGEIAPVNPTLGERADGLHLFYRADHNRLRVGVVDMQGTNRIAAGAGTVLELTVPRGEDFELELSDAIVVDEKGNKMAVSLAKSESSETLPDECELGQNYPNPFNPTTSIRYSLARASEIKLQIFNVLGQKVRTLVDGYSIAGTHEAEWDGRADDHTPVASGVYLYKLSAGDFRDIRTMILLK